MSVEHPVSLESELHHAFAERVAWHTAVVVNGSLTESRLASGRVFASEGLGIGSACCWNGRKLIITAKHVVEGATPSDIRFFLRQDRPIDWNTRPSRQSADPATVLPVEEIVRCPWEDLACIVLAPNDPDRRLEFVDLPNDFGDVPSDGGGALIHGAPIDKVVAIGEGRLPDGSRWRSRAVQVVGCWAVVTLEAPRFFPSSFDPDRHFLLRYDPIVEGSLPFGFSGTGVWYRRRRNDSVWAADPVLAGVQVGWHRESRLMIAVRSQAVRQFLEESLG